MNNKNILHLTLKKKWFDMILSGEKTEEYREIKPHWCHRLTHYSLNQILQIIKLGKVSKIKFSDYQVIRFTNGYGAHRPAFDIELKEITIGQGRTHGWGANPGHLYFIFRLGKISNKRNIEE